MKFTVGQIAELLQGSVEGHKEEEITTVAKIEEGHKGALSFLANLKYEEHIYHTQSSAVLVDKNFMPQKPLQTTLIRVENAYQAFTQLLHLYQEFTQNQLPKGLEHPCFVHPSATIDKDTIYVGAFAYIGQGAKIGKNVRIYPHAYIGENVQIADHSILYAGVKIYKDTQIGASCIIHAGAVIGADGFGFAPQNDGSYHKIPQIGNVIIEDDVEIGANATIDRATMGSTLIKKGVKIDNLVQIGHNVVVGENTVMAAQVGVAGSTKIGKNCLFGGQAGLAGHLEIADAMKISGQAGLTKSFYKKGEAVLGAPAMNQLEFAKCFSYFKNMPKLWPALEKWQKETLKKLEK